LAIFAGFASAYTIFGSVIQEVQQIIAGCIVLFFIGLKDDIVSVSPFKKFFVQILAAGIVVFMGDLRITSFQGVFGIYELEYGLSYGITFLVIIGITNAVNLIDGLDGLAASLTLVMISIFGYYFAQSNTNEAYSYAGIAFCIGGSIVGFLRYNIFKAVIFMGDTGSLICGFLISILAIKFLEMKLVSAAPATTIAIIIIPLVDTIRVFSIRILKGRSPFSPDKNHLHHNIARFGMNSIKVVLALCCINLVFFITVRTFNEVSDTYLILSMIIVSVLLCSIFEIRKRIA